jgi:hypothetical protein
VFFQLWRNNTSVTRTFNWISKESRLHTTNLMRTVNLLQEKDLQCNFLKSFCTREQPECKRMPNAGWKLINPRNINQSTRVTHGCYSMHLTTCSIWELLKKFSQGKICRKLINAMRDLIHVSGWIQFPTTCLETPTTNGNSPNWVTWQWHLHASKSLPHSWNRTKLPFFTFNISVQKPVLSPLNMSRKNIAAARRGAVLC